MNTGTSIRTITITLSLLTTLCIAIAAPKIDTSSKNESSYPNKITSIEEYNDTLPYWGTTWKPAAGNRNNYHPNFYTGFAMRSQFPNRIHIRQARGNETRVTVTLDDQTIKDYLFDLVKRYDVYKKLQEKGRINPLPEANAVPHLRFFYDIIESPTYGILNTVRAAQAGKGESDVENYKRALSILSTLNPGRVFPLRLNLTSEFLKWKNFLKSKVKNPDAYFANEENAVLALNNILWGRINLIEEPSKELLTSAIHAAQLAAVDSNEEFLAAALKTFKLATASKYNFKVVNNNQLVDALQCSDLNNCTLSYSEFTTIYPTGSALSWQSDDRGNRIHSLRSPGLWNFYGPDRIDMGNPYYGWAPKMYYEQAGNAYHNPAVQFTGIDTGTKRFLGSPDNHSVLWAVKRGAVSHGCSRLGQGHVWEFRHIFPVEMEKMQQVHVFIHNSIDFDVYDVDGNGSLEVMGVEYFISYDYKNNNDDSREAEGLVIGSDQKLSFYNELYGKKDVFKQKGDKFIILNPTVSMPSHLNFKQLKVSVRPQLDGEFPLYEQKYEKDKVQLILGKADQGLIRFLGHIRGCAPSSNKVECGEATFRAEAKSYVGELP